MTPLLELLPPHHRDGLSLVLVSPRYPTSRFAVAVFGDAGGRARYVAKLARGPGSAPELDDEAASLRRVAAGWGAAAGAPELVRRTRWGGVDVLVQTAVPGRPLNQRTTRRHSRRLLDQAADWAAGAPFTGVAGPGWFEREVRPSVGTLADTGPGAAALAERTLELTAPLTRPDLPVVDEHGDLREGNVLVCRAGWRVIDWATARGAGLPGADLAVFAAYVATARARARRADAVNDAVTATFRPDGPGRRVVAAELERRGVADCVDAVLVAATARHAAALVERLRSVGVADPATAAAAELATWRAALAAAGARSRR